MRERTDLLADTSPKGSPCGRRGRSRYSAYSLIGIRRSQKREHNGGSEQYPTDRVYPIQSRPCRCCHWSSRGARSWPFRRPPRSSIHTWLCPESHRIHHSVEEYISKCSRRSLMVCLTSVLVHQLLAFSPNEAWTPSPIPFRTHLHGENFIRRHNES